MISAGFTLWRQFNKSLYERYSRRSIIIIITAAIVLLSAPAFALVIYAGYSLFGSRSMSDGDGHQGTMVTISWAVSTNAETKGDRLIPLAAETVRQRFVFDTPPIEQVPLPRPRPQELIALDAPQVDLQPALGQDKREECEWDKHKTLPDFMRSCVGPPLQLTPPQQ